MPTPSPKIDRRDFDAILKEVRELAPFYTPEWNARRDTGPSAALLKIFAGLLEGLIRRLNDVPMRNFIAFFDRLGLKLLPAQPARAPLTFLLSAGAKEAVEIPPRSQAVASPAGQEPIAFETEKSILATPAKLKAVLSVVPGSDQVFDHLPDLPNQTGSRIFADDNLQQHILYLGHDDLFNLKGPATIELQPSLSGGTLNQLAALNWQYFAERETPKDGVKNKEIGWWDFSSNLARGKLLLVKTNNDEIKQTEINGVKSRWIRCRRTTPLLSGDPLTRLTLAEVKAGPQQTGLQLEAAFANDVPLPLPPSSTPSFLPFGPRPRQGDAFYLASREAFSKKGATITLDLQVDVKAMPAMDIERVQGLGKQFAFRLKKNRINTIPELLRLTPETLAGFIRNTTKNIPASAYVVRSQNILEAAAKQYYDKVVSSGGASAPSSGGLADLSLSWEYWNGKAWLLIKGLVDESRQLLKPGASKVTFPCPDDLAPVNVAGQENYWIRVRIAFGDYGAEEIRIPNANSPDPKNPPRVEINKDNLFPPRLLALTLGYSAAQPVAVITTRNNLQFRAETTASFAPFVALDDRAQSLYLGFDPAPLKGPISMFFSLAEQEYPEDNRPRLEWEYFRQRTASEPGEWTRLLVEDGTRSLTESGVLQFIGPRDFERATRFGQSLYWIRALNTENIFQLAKQPIEPAPDPGGEPELDPPPCPELPPCEESLQLFHPSFSGSINTSPPPPRVQAIHLNTTWAIQAETINDELLGSGTGLGNQAFTVARFPVLSETVWVNELGSLTESERKALVEAQTPEVEERKDSAGNVTAFWVRWQAADDLTAAGANDRAFDIDRAFGRVRFGDGIHGRTLPIGRDNVKATYQAGGGARGNVAAEEIKGLRTTIPSVDSVINPEPAGGGSDVETVESALERGPQMLRHRSRAITAADFESLAREASRSVARVKCLPNFTDKGLTETGWVMVIIVPQSPDARPMPSPQLRASVEKSLRDAAANVASFPRQVKVNAPVYVEVAITADLFAERIDLAPQVEAAALADLQKYLHPLTGGYQLRGWEFGRLPCLSDFYARLEAIRGVDHVTNVKMSLQAITPTGERRDLPRLVTEEQSLAVEMPEYALVFSGEHKLTVKVLG